MAVPLSIEVEHQAQRSAADEASLSRYRAFGLGFLSGGLACACVAALALSGMLGSGSAPVHSKFAPLVGMPSRNGHTTAMEAQRGIFDLFGPKEGGATAVAPVRAPLRPEQASMEEKRAAAQARAEEARLMAQLRKEAPSTDFVDEEDQLLIKPPLTEEEILMNFIPPPDPYRPVKTEVTEGKGVTVTTIRLGDTFTFPKRGDTVTIDFIGKVRGTEKQFDSTLKDGEPFTFTLGQGKVVPGLEEGILKMSLGESAQMVVDSQAGYGAAGRGKLVPPGADLVFDVDLFAINGAAAGPNFGGISIGR